MERGTFVGRESELEALEHALQTARAGSGCLVFISGEAGMGKTRLAQELVTRAVELEVPAAWGGCPEAEGVPPFWPWTQALGRRRLAAGSSEVLDGLTGRRPAENRFQLFEWVVELIASAAEASGLLLVLDDLHWADPASLVLLQVVAGRLPDSHTMVVATFRDEPAGARSALTDYLPALLRERATARLRLEALPEADVRRILTEVTGDELNPEAQERVVRRAAGNPFFVRELAAAVSLPGANPEAVPGGIRALIWQRLKRLSPDDLALLGVAAVCGHEFRFNMLRRLAGRSAETVLQALERAGTAGLMVREGPGWFRFAHALIRDAVYENLSTAERVDLHRSAADFIEQLGPEGQEQLLDALAYHRRQAAVVDGATAALTATITAAAAAEKRLAFELAAEQYRQALMLLEQDPEAGDRADLLVKLAAAHYRAGAVRAAWAACQEAVTAARSAGDWAGLARAALVMRGVGDPDVAGALYHLAAEALNRLERSDQAIEAELLAQMTIAGNQVGVWLAPPGLGARALEVARQSGQPEAVLAGLQASHIELGGPAHVRARLVIAEEAIDLSSKVGALSVTAWARACRVEALWELGDRRQLEVELGAHAALTQRLAEPLGRWRHVVFEAALATMEGRHERALALIEEGRAMGRQGGHQTAEYVSLALLDVLRSQTGGLDEVEPAVAAMGQSTAVWHASLLAGVGRGTEARSLLARALPDLDDAPRGALWPAYMLAAARVAVEAQDAELALEVRQRLKPFAGLHSTIGPYRGPYTLTLGRLALVSGDLQAAIADLRQAIADSSALGAVPYEAYARAYLGVALLRTGGRSEHPAAVAELQTGRDLAARLQMQPLLAEIDHQMHQLGGRGSRPLQLSRRELEVAGLVADGLTNRQIAGHLHLSERTAENHVKNIMDKLGFHSRAQIAGWLVSIRTRN